MSTNGINIAGFRTIAIQTIINGLNAPNVKQFFQYDSDGDPTSIFYVQANAPSGEQCLEQVLEYAVVASGIKQLVKQAWRNATWSGSEWDIAA